jgi:hypothetical protein
MSLFRFPFGRNQGTSSQRPLRRGFSLTPRQTRSTAKQQLSAESLERRAMLAATIIEVSSTLDPGTVVGIGDTIPFQVIYDDPVSVGANPVAYVNVTKAGGAQATARFTGLSGGGRILNFTYTVAAGDSATQFDVLTGTTFLIGGSIMTISDSAVADRSVVAGDPTITELQPGLRVDGIAPATPTVDPTVYVNPTVWQSGAWATLHPGYFAIKGAAGSGPLAADEVLTVTVNGATYRATSSSSSAPGNFFVNAAGEWEILVRSVGGDPATSPFSGVLAPWSTTNNDIYNVVATLTDEAGNASTDTTSAEVVIDMTGPTVARVSAATPNGFYGVGATLEILVQYNEPVRVMGTPTITINVTNAVTPGNRTATFVGLDPLDGRIARFSYTVQAGDSTPSTGLDYVGTTAIAVGSGFIEDQAGNPATNTLTTTPGGPPPAQQSIVGSGDFVVVDTTAPLVAAAGVSSSIPDGTYFLGGPVIPITVTFSKTVFVTGTPQLALNSAAGRVASYVSGSGTNTLTFNYVVQTGDDTNGLDLDQSSSTALTLNGGQIADAAGNNAILALAAPGAAGSLSANKSIVIAAAPTILQVSSPDAAGNYSAGQTVRVWVLFSKVMNIVPGPAPTLQLAVPPALPTAVATFNGNYINGSGAMVTTPTNIMQFEYIVRPGDTSSGQPLNYVPNGLNPGAGIRYQWTGPALPGFLNADLSTLPLPSNAALNALPANNIVITPDTTVPLAPDLSLTADTFNAIGVNPTDGITSNVNVNVQGLETLPNTRWEYRYRSGGTAAGTWTSWTTGTNVSFALPGNVAYAAGTIEVRQTDWSGNVSLSGSNTTVWNLDISAPVGPTAATITETGAPGSGITRNPLVTVTGLEAGALLQYNTTYNSTNQTVTGAWVSVSNTGTSSFAGGSASFSLPAGNYNPANGTGVVVRQMDLAGNTTTTGPWTQLTTSGGGTTVIVVLDTTIAVPMIALTADTTPGFSPFNGVPYTTDGVTSNGQISVSGLEVQNLTAAPPVAGIASWEYRISGGAWTLGGTTAPTGSFTLPAGTYAPGAVEVRETDQAGNVATVQNTTTWTIEQTAPVITAITAPAGTYLPGSTITISVTMSETVFVSAATATLSLNAGGVATLVQPAVPSTTLQFAYTIPQGATTSGGVLAITGIALNGTTIADLAGNQFVAALPQPAPIPLPGVVLDQTAPAITGITAIAGSYIAGQTVVLAVNFSEPVFATGTTATLSVNSAVGRVATLATPVTPGSTSLLFNYVVEAGDATPQLQVTAFNLNGTVIRDQAGNASAGTLPTTPLTVIGPVVIDASIQATAPTPPNAAPGFGYSIATAPAYSRAVTRILIRFTVPVRNVSLSSLRLFLGPRAVSLKGARLTGSGTDYTLTLPSKLTNPKGLYRLDINGLLTGIVSVTGGTPMTTTSSLFWRRV